MLSAGLGIVLATGIATGSALGAPPPPVAQGKFSLSNPHSHGDKGLVIVEFLANQNKHRRITSIAAENVFGVEGVEHADLVVELSLSCDPVPEQTQTTERIVISPTFYVVHGPHGFGEIHVKGNRFSYKAPAFDGLSSQGQLTFSGRFSHRGEVVAGSITADIPSFKGVPSNPFTGVGTYTNCRTDPETNPARVGQPLWFHIHGAG